MTWVQGSKQAKTYVHLSGKDVDKANLGLYGIQEPEDSINKLKPMTCPRFRPTNDLFAKFCSHCSLGLDEISLMKYDKEKEDDYKNLRKKYSV